MSGYRRYLAQAMVWKRQPSVVALFVFAAMVQRLAASESASIAFFNDMHGDRDVHIYYVQPHQPTWPPNPPSDPTDAVQVRCRLARREGTDLNVDHHVDRAADYVRLKQQLRVRGNFTITVRKDWAPLGARHFLHLVSLGFFDGVCLFRAVKDFLVQFGVSSNETLQKRWGPHRIPDDPPRPELLPLPRGTLSFAGFGKDSRSSQVWLSFGAGVAGSQLWETPVGYVDPRKGGLDVMASISTAYGDLSVFGGRAPDESTIAKPDGLERLRRDYPDIDYLESCVLESGVVNGSSEDVASQSDLVEVAVVKAGDVSSQVTLLGHKFVAKLGGLNGKPLGHYTVTEANQEVHLTSPNEL